MTPPIFKNVCSLLLFIVMTMSLQAQTKTFDDVLEVRLQDMGPIYQDQQVKGYYLFYNMEKADRKNNNYKLIVLDDNLNKVSEKDMTESKYIRLSDAAYDEQSLFFVFYESREKKLEFRRYDTQCKLLSKKTEELSNREAGMYENPADYGAMNPINLAPVVGKGFVHYTLQKNNKIGYSIRFFGEEGHKDWTYRSAEKSDEMEFPFHLGYSDKLLLTSIIKKKGAMSRDLDFYLQGIDIETGKKVFEKTLDDPKYAIQLLNAFPDPSGDIILSGVYFDKDDKLAKAASLGLFTGKMNSSGEFVTRNYISWAKDVSKKLPTNSKGKVEGGGYVFFHKALRNSEGKFFAIGEMYGKAASALGIATTALGVLSGGGGASVVKIEVRDMVVFEFNPDLTLADVKVFEKKSSGIELPSGAEFSSTQLLGNYVNYLGGFDYMYTQKNEDASIISFCYDNYERAKGKTKHVLGVVSRRAGEQTYATDKISLETDASWIRSYPAKPGYVLLMEYFRKKKKVDLRLEKFNN